MIDTLDDSYESDLTDKESEQLLLRSEHAVAPPLSPAAKAVLQAFNSTFDWIEDGVPGPQFISIAAALRAAADQLGEELEFYSESVVSVTDIHALASELEAHWLCPPPC